ncbi:hypothetical protein ACHAWX_004744 [Stephanocyclus meneghinianus]
MAGNGSQTMIKLNHLRIAFATASILVAQQMIGNSRMLTYDSRENPSRFLDQPDTLRVHRIDVKERRHALLVEPPTNIYVLGERNSGTTFTAKVLRQAFDAPNEPDQTRKHEYFSSDIPVLLHKHMFRHFLLNETELDVISMRTDILWLFAVRSPCEVRMYTKKFLAYFLLEVNG